MNARYFRMMETVCFTDIGDLNVRNRYSCSQLYNIVSDVKSYPRFVPYCTDARILSATQAQERSDNPVELDAELTVGFLTFQEKYISRVVCKKNESVEVRLL